MTVYGKYVAIAFKSCIQIFTVKVETRDEFGGPFVILEPKP